MAAAAIPIDAAALVECAHSFAVAHRQPAEGRFFGAGEDLENAVARHGAIAIHDRRCAARALDGQVIGDIEIAKHRGIVNAWPGQQEHARGQGDGVRPGAEIGLLDGRAQRAASVRGEADAIAHVRVGQVGGAGDGIRRCQCRHLSGERVQARRDKQYG